jgi:hypothetical protein
VRLLFAQRPSTDRAGAMTNTFHWAYGAGWGRLTVAGAYRLLDR